MLWDIDNGECIIKIKGPYYNIIPIHEDLYIGASHGKNIYILDLKRDRVDKLLGRYTLNGHTRQIKSIVRCSDYIWSSSYDNTIKLWNIPNFYEYKKTLSTSINENNETNTAYIDHYMDKLLCLIFASILYINKKSRKN